MVLETVNKVSCDSITFVEQIYGSTGVYTHALTSAGGCDSIVSLNLVMFPQGIGSISETACNSYTLNDITYSSSGLYVLTNIASCDTVTLNR